MSMSSSPWPASSPAGFHGILLADEAMNGVALGLGARAMFMSRHALFWAQLGGDDLAPRRADDDQVLSSS